jgi:hypothetical protein
MPRPQWKSGDRRTTPRRRPTFLGRFLNRRRKMAVLHHLLDCDSDDPRWPLNSIPGQSLKVIGPGPDGPPADALGREPSSRPKRLWAMMRCLRLRAVDHPPASTRLSHDARTRSHGFAMPPCSWGEIVSARGPTPLDQQWNRVGPATPSPSRPGPPRWRRDVGVHPATRARCSAADTALVSVPNGVQVQTATRCPSQDGAWPFVGAAPVGRISPNMGHVHGETREPAVCRHPVLPQTFRHPIQGRSSLCRYCEVDPAPRRVPRGFGRPRPGGHSDSGRPGPTA